MRVMTLVGEMLIAGYLFLDGMNRILVPIPAAPASVPWLAGFSYVAQWIMYVVGGLEFTACLAILLYTMEDLSELSVTMHPPHHGAHP